MDDSFGVDDAHVPGARLEVVAGVLDGALAEDELDPRHGAPNLTYAMGERILTRLARAACFSVRSMFFSFSRTYQSAWRSSKDLSRSSRACHSRPLASSFALSSGIIARDRGRR